MPRPAGQYPNPYDFVPFEGAPSHVQAASFERYFGLTGTIRFNLETLTPVCVLRKAPKDNQSASGTFARNGDQPVIPASSLKGMLRSVHEVVTNSRMGKLTPRADHATRTPQAYRPGSELSRLTLSEALFGITPSGDTDDGIGGQAGRIFLDDIPIPKTQLNKTTVARPDGGEPNPENEPFYFGSNTVALGRKFYYHQDPSNVARVYSGRDIPQITVETFSGSLSGCLRFIDLDRQALADLVYTLVLEDALAHKIGYSKPCGLGSIRMNIEQLIVESLGDDEVPNRFHSYSDPPLEDWTAQVSDFRNEARDAWLRRPKGKLSHDAFSAISHWQNTQIFAYPENGNPKKIPLWKWQEREMVYPTPDMWFPHVRAIEVGTPIVDTSSQTFELKDIFSGELICDDQYGHFVEAGGIKFRLDNESCSLELRDEIQNRLQSNQKVRIRFRREKIRKQVTTGKGKKQKTRTETKNVLRDVELAPVTKP